MFKFVSFTGSLVITFLSISTMAETDTMASSLVTVGGRHFMISRNMLDPIDNVSGGGQLLFLQLTFLLSNSLAPKTSDSLDNVTVAIQTTNQPLTNDIIRDRLLSLPYEKSLSIDHGYDIYQTVAGDVFVDRENDSFFFSCARLPKYNQNSTHIYTGCISISMLPGGLKRSISFDPHLIPRARLLNNAADNFVKQIEVSD